MEFKNFISNLIFERVKLYLFLFFFLSFLNSFSATIYVKYDASGANNGTSWTNAYTSFQSALDVATSGDKIYVARGTYKPSYDYGLGGGSEFYHFRMINGVGIYGGFAGTETSESQRANYGDGEANETILSGDLNSNGLDNVDVHHLFYHPSGTNLTSSAILDGFTLTCAYSDGADPHGKGGVMFNYGSSPSLTNLIMKNNRSNNVGSCLYNGYSSSPYFYNCKFYQNYSTVYDEWFSSSTFDRCAIFNNTGFNNGFVYSSYQNNNPVFKNSIIYNNNGYNVVLLNANSNATFTNVTIYNNNGNSEAGVLWTNLSNCTFNNCIIFSNTGSSGRNFSLNNSETVTLNNCVFDNLSNSVNIVNTGSFIQNNCITSNPLFVDAANNDFRLSYNSPCLDAGNSSYNSESYDIRGSSYARKLNKSTGNAGTIDIGAYEFKAGYDALTITHSSLSSKKGKSINASAYFLATAVPSVSAKGYVWSTTSGPTVALATKTSDSPSSSSYTDNITGLAYGTTYYLKAYATNSAGTYYSDEVSFTTLTYEQEIETLAPNDGDGDNDGVQDSEQLHVHSIKNNFTDKYITIKSFNGNALNSVEVQSASSDSRYYYPGSLSKFTISGSTATVKLYFHNISSLQGYSYRKKKANGDFFNFTNYSFSSEIINGKTVATATLYLTDGGPEDYDGVVNGSITDPGGPAN